MVRAERERLFMELALRWVSGLVGREDLDKWAHHSAGRVDSKAASDPEHP